MTVEQPENERARPVEDSSESGAVALEPADETPTEPSTSAESWRQDTLLRQVMDSISCGVLVADRHGNFKVFNKAAERIVGIGAVPQGPESWPDAYGIFRVDGETRFPAAELPLVRALSGQSADFVEMFIRNGALPEGAFLSVSGRPLRDENGELRGGVAVFEDVTARKRAEREALAAAESEALQTGRLEIASSVLHDIGNAITGAGTQLAQMLDEPAWPENRGLARLQDLLRAHSEALAEVLGPDRASALHEYMAALSTTLQEREQRIRGQNRTLVQFIRHIQDIITIQRQYVSNWAGRPASHNALAELVTHALAIQRHAFARRGIAVYVDLPATLPALSLDQTHIVQLLVNLLKNSCEAIAAAEREGPVGDVTGQATGAVTTDAVTDRDRADQPF